MAMIMHGVPSGLVQLQQLWTHELRHCLARKRKALEIHLSCSIWTLLRGRLLASHVTVNDEDY